MSHVVTFYSTPLFGISRELVAWYRYAPTQTLQHKTDGTVDKEVTLNDEPVLKVGLIDCETVFEFHGDEAQELLRQLQHSYTPSLSDEEKQNAIASLRRFFNEQLNPGCNRDRVCAAKDSVAKAEKALSILGA